MSLSVGLFVYFNLKTAKPQERFMDGQTRLGFENKLVEQKSLNSPDPFESRLYQGLSPDGVLTHTPNQTFSFCQFLN